MKVRQASSRGRLTMPFVSLVLVERLHDLMHIMWTLGFKGFWFWDSKFENSFGNKNKFQV